MAKGDKYRVKKDTVMNIHCTGEAGVRYTIFHHLKKGDIVEHYYSDINPATDLYQGVINGVTLMVSLMVSGLTFDIWKNWDNASHFLDLKT